jgi:hypothetical protein
MFGWNPSPEEERAKLSKASELQKLTILNSINEIDSELTSLRNLKPTSHASRTHTLRLIKIKEDEAARLQNMLTTETRKGYRVAGPASSIRRDMDYLAWDTKTKVADAQYARPERVATLMIKGQDAQKTLDVTSTMLNTAISQAASGMDEFDQEEFDLQADEMLAEEQTKDLYNLPAVFASPAPPVYPVEPIALTPSHAPSPSFSAIEPPRTSDILLDQDLVQRLRRFNIDV